MYPKYKTADWAWLLVTLCSVAATSFYTDKSDRTDYTSSFCFCSQATTILLPLPLSSRECCVVAGVEWTWNIREREREKEEWWGVRGGRRRRTEERTETEFVRELLRVKHSLISISLSLSLSLSHPAISDIHTTIATTIHCVIFTPQPFYIRTRSIYQNNKRIDHICTPDRNISEEHLYYIELSLLKTGEGGGREGGRREWEAVKLNLHWLEPESSPLQSCHVTSRLDCTVSCWRMMCPYSKKSTSKL